MITGIALASMPPEAWASTVLDRMSSADAMKIALDAYWNAETPAQERWATERIEVLKTLQPPEDERLYSFWLGREGTELAPVPAWPKLVTMEAPGWLSPDFRTTALAAI